MNTPRYFLVTLFSLIYTVCSGQSAATTYDVGLPLDIQQKGWNKVLCMKSGYTMLFHLEPEKAILVKVFDTSHRRAVTKKHPCNVLDITMLRTAIFKGLYDINGEAVLFVEQERYGRHALVRLRFNGKNGKLIEEKQLAESQGIGKPMHFFVMKNKEEDSYSILYSTDHQQFRECKLNIDCFNNKHQITKSIPLNIDRKAYDYLSVVNAEWQPAGIFISVVLSRVKVNGTPVHSGVDFDPVPPVTDHFLQMFFIPKGSDVPKSRVVDVSTDVYPYYANYTYNPFARTANLLLLSYKEALCRSGLELLPTALTANLFFKLEEDNMAPRFNWVENRMANAYLAQKTDTNHHFQGLPVKTFTNENGLTTLMSASFSRYSYNLYENAGLPSHEDRFNRSEYMEQLSHQRSRVYETYIGNIGITQLDDDGNELWGTVLPCSQYLKSNQHYYFAHEFSKKWQEQLMFGDWPPQVYERQFISFNTYTRDKNLYVIYNDYDKNIANAGAASDTVYSFEHTNAVLYTINGKHEITKRYLLGDPGRGEYKTSFVEGADFDEERGIYATLIQYNRRDHMSLKMAWAHLD